MQVLSWNVENLRTYVETTPGALATYVEAIVNVYAVNGTNKPYGDHDLGGIEGDRHEWTRRFIERLAEECASLKARGLELLLLGDCNVSRTKLDAVPRLRTEEPHATARAAFNEVFIPSLDVVEVFRELHPTAKKYTWHRRGARRPDAAPLWVTLRLRGVIAARARARRPGSRATSSGRAGCENSVGQRARAASRASGVASCGSAASDEERTCGPWPPSSGDQRPPAVHPRCEGRGGPGRRRSPPSPFVASALAS